MNRNKNKRRFTNWDTFTNELVIVIIVINNENSYQVKICPDFVGLTAIKAMIMKKKKYQGE